MTAASSSASLAERIGPRAVSRLVQAARHRCRLRRHPGHRSLAACRPRHDRSCGRCPDRPDRPDRHPDPPSRPRNADEPLHPARRSTRDQHQPQPRAPTLRRPAQPARSSWQRPTVTSSALGPGHAAVVGSGFRAGAVVAALRSRVVVDGRRWVLELDPVVGEPFPAGRLINHPSASSTTKPPPRTASSCP